MSQSEKAQYYNALKNAGVNFDRHYREYSTAELKAAHDRMFAAQPEPEPQTAPPVPPAAPAAPPVPHAQANPNELPGTRLNTKAPDEPIRVDDLGNLWFQEEVRKPAAPRPRGRRVLKYMETGVVEESVKNGEYVETFEVAGNLPGRPAEVKITLPSYQVGIYKDPRLPFKIYVYNENRGFDFFEVNDFYGGAELVPEEVKRMYVENVLCYDIRTTVRAIQTEYRQLQLTGRAK